MNLQVWQAGGDYFSHNGQRIFFRVEGDGPALLLVHGYPTASWDWHKVWPALCDRFTCISYDMLGFGFSDKPRKPYRIIEQADIACALLERLHIDCCDVLAHDYGDSVAQELLARSIDGSLPFALRRVCLLNGGLFPETHRAVLAQKLLLSPLGGLVTKLMSRRTLASNFRQIFGPDTPPSEQEIDAFWQLLVHNGGKQVMHRLIHYIHERGQQRERWVGALQNTTVPLCLVDGLHDPVSGAHMVARYRQLVLAPNVVELPGIGHYPQVEAPEAVLDAVFAHLA